MKIARYLFNAGYVLIALLFMCTALGLILFAAYELWLGLNPGGKAGLPERLSAVIEAIGLLTIAVAALELGQTILEEEVLRQTHVSAPTRVRRFLSRFMVVLVVALAIECLVGVFEFLHSDPGSLPQATLIGFVAAALLAAWGLFIRFNRSAEELEPEAMEEAKQEDKQVAQ
ncbi:MAG: hypothetical protein HGA45_27760 [Chloroflexales bacterium]|nr:hypothetical protein [Chloroflexales bacterium]